MGKYSTADLSKHFAWDGTNLVTTDQSVVDTLRRKALSPSTAKSMRGCSASWAADRILAQWENPSPFDPAPIGTSAHAVMEDLMNFPAQERSPGLAKMLLSAAADAMWGVAVIGPTDTITAMVADQKYKWIRAVRDAMSGLFVIEKIEKVDVYGGELQIDGIFIAGVPANGFIDRTDRVKGGLKAIDYKTGNMPAAYKIKKYGDDHGDQLRIYKAALEEKFHEPAVAASVYYTGKEFQAEREVDISPRAMNKTLTAFAASWDKHNALMETGSFDTVTGALCGWCPLVNSCPSAEAEGIGDAYKGGKNKKKTSPSPSKVALGIPVIRQIFQVATDNALSAGAPLAPLPAVGAPMAEAALVEVVSREVPPALIEGVIDSNIEKENTMAILRDSPYKEMLPSGEFNPSSWGYYGMVGMLNKAVTLIRDANRPIVQNEVDGLFRTMRLLAHRLQNTWVGGDEDIQAQDHATCRMVMYTAIDARPAPFGGPPEAWKAWTLQVYTEAEYNLQIAVAERENDVDKAPWNLFDPNYTANVSAPEQAIEAQAPPAEVDFNFDLSANTDQPAPVNQGAPLSAPAPKPFNDFSDIPMNDWDGME